MSNVVTPFDVSPQTEANAGVEVFDPPMCCPTGLCGPTLDQTLLDVSEMILVLKAANVRIERCQMSRHPRIFTRHAEVMRLIREQQVEALPITLVRGKVMKVGAYPTLAEVQSALAQGQPRSSAPGW